jgi:hypothetical protein
MSEEEQAAMLGERGTMKVRNVLTGEIAEVK